MGIVSRIKLEDLMIDVFGFWWLWVFIRKFLEFFRSLFEL